MADSTDEIDVVQVPENNRFEARTAQGVTAGYITYQVRGEGLFNKVLVLPHTVVDPQFEGRGIGSRLVREAFSWARKIGAKVDPVCPFVATYIERNPVYSDLLEA
ncbi:GNAT family N-acetyltransferase [Jonesia quinghaiensis]|uniref:GNAT family N-acetyltransferase n=1 Tax=Jonesia quinghaiensis TaxID=262806 RepID=UPI00041B5F72|nr:GNAT family N-acetyltransferase [Jonesia quinghaiensis]